MFISSYKYETQTQSKTNCCLFVSKDYICSPRTTAPKIHHILFKYIDRGNPSPRHTRSFLIIEVLSKLGAFHNFPWPSSFFTHQTYPWTITGEASVPAGKSFFGLPTEIKFCGETNLWFLVPFSLWKETRSVLCIRMPNIVKTSLPVFAFSLLWEILKPGEAACVHAHDALPLLASESSPEWLKHISSHLWRVQV